MGRKKLIMPTRGYATAKEPINRQMKKHVASDAAIACHWIRSFTYMYCTNFDRVSPRPAMRLTTNAEDSKDTLEL